jgi:hypothetical protein
MIGASTLNLGTFSFGLYFDSMTFILALIYREIKKYFGFLSFI